MASILLGLLTILVWSGLALLSTWTADLPPLFSAGSALLLGGLLGLPRAREWRLPPATLALGFGGIFGYHALLFAAFDLAPALEVNLINYLWPLLIVLLAPVLLRGYALGPLRLLGAAVGLLGALLVVGGGRLEPELSALPGYLLAAAAALVWASYSLLTKRVPPFPTGAVGLFCLLSGLASLGLWALGELAAGGRLILPALSRRELLALLLLGLGPMGGAFYAWDAALKRGDPRVLGSLAYLTPLLSTLNLALFGGKRLSGAALAAMLLIVAGSLLGALGGGRDTAPRLKGPRGRAPRIGAGRD